MSNLLSIPTFVSGPDDKLITTDLYKASGKLINELRDISDVFKATELDILKGGNTLLENTKSSIIKSFDQSKSAIELDTDSLIKGLISVNPGMVSALRALPTDMQAELTKVSGFSEIAGTFNGIASTVKQASLSTVNGLGKLINGISGAALPFNFTDKNGLAQFSAALIIQASRIGIKGVFKAFVDNITDKVMLRGIVSKVAGTAIANSMTDLLKDMGDSVAGRILVKTVGGIALRYTRDYAAPHRGSLSDKYAKYQNTKIALDTLLDEWIFYRRGNTDAYEGGYMQTGSDDFITSVLIAAKYQMNYIIPEIPGYNSAENTSPEAYMALITRNLNTTAKESLKRDFPLAVIR
jgi:hypothetical protein